MRRPNLGLATRNLLVAALMLSLCVAYVPARAADAGAASTTPIEFGIDRSNMATEWTLSPPSEPNVYPFNGSYNGPGVFEARRVAVFDGIARLHPQWFRDGFSADTPQGAALFADTVTQVHARGMKILAVVGPTGSDYDAADIIAGNPKVNGCRWSTAPLSKIRLDKFSQRVRRYFDVLKAKNLDVDAFEIGNELDLYCNDADMPMTSQFAAHQWKWFLTADQVHAFDAGYVPFLTTFAELIKAYFPKAKIITFGMSNPSGNSAPLIAGLAHFTDASGKTADYTKVVDGYGTHIYPSSITTRRLVEGATAELTQQAATLPHSADKPLWITEWSESGSAFWSSHSWYFQYNNAGKVGGDLNQAAAPYPAMNRAQAISAFETDVIEKLRRQAKAINIASLFYYSYDSADKTPMCDKTTFNPAHHLNGICASGVIDPTTGDLLPDVAKALIDR